MKETKNLTSTLLTEILYQELNNFLRTKDKPPNIINITIGDNFANQIYSKMKNQTITKKTPIQYTNIHFDKITYQELTSYIKELNNDQEITGIMLQLPLPNYLKEYEREILDTISPFKDIDGLTSTSQALLNNNEDTLIPCTALGIETLLKAYSIPLKKKRVAIINRSNIIGKPLYQLLLRNNAIPIICHSKIDNLKEITNQSDIIIAALNKPEYITSDYIKEGSIIIDVGVHQNSQGKTIGDVNYQDVYPKASLITPPVGAVGPMTICILAYNATKCLYKQETNQLLSQAISKAKEKISIL